MTISSSLNAGVSGLSANASRLATISDNIANSSTYGYKRVDTEFSSLVMGNSGRSYTAGGVTTYNTRDVDSKGAMISTDSALDLAVRGQGMLPVASEAQYQATGEPELLLTSTGSFNINNEGYMINEAGYYLMGWPANFDGTIPSFARDTTDGLEPVQFSQSLTGDPTTEIDIALNLPATSTVFGADGSPYQTSIEYFGNLGVSESLTLTFTPSVPAAAGPATNQWDLSITDSAQAGAVIGDYTITFDATQANGGQILTVTETVGGAYDPNAGTMDIVVAGGTISVDIGAANTVGGLSQLSDRFAPLSISKNGSAIGNMVGVEVDANGYVSAIFDTGITQVKYQVPLADLPNVNGMTALDAQTFMPTPESGPFYLWDAGDGPTGDVRSYALEESTTDVAKELTSMIQTQRAYSSNAKVIQTVDEMLQETTNIKR